MASLRQKEDPHFAPTFHQPFVSDLDYGLRQVHPQQNLFLFHKGERYRTIEEVETLPGFEKSDPVLEVSSQFDSGNMKNCTLESPNLYYIWISPDSIPFDPKGHYKTWFYFSVKGVQKGQTLTFSVRNMGNQGRLFKTGLRPVFRSTSNMKWRRVLGKVEYKVHGSQTNFVVNWNHTFDSISGPEEEIYFAYTYPFSYGESIRKTQKLVKKLSSSSQIYIHREVLSHSLEGREMEVLTLSSYKGITSQHEPMDPKGRLYPLATPDSRPLMFENKKMIFLTARVHPGETPASFVLSGILSFLTGKINETNQSEQAKILMDEYVFKVVPMLNPDGVYRGYYRFDTTSKNLNRYYGNPDWRTEPTIYAIKQALVYAYKNLNMQVYVDLHAHASKRGCFMFGNSLKGEDQLMNMVLPKLISMNSLNFDFMECSFSDKMMHCKDKKDGLSREGSGRVSIMKACNGLPNCYTLECNYASGKRINHLFPKLIKETGKVEAESWITDEKCQFYQEYKDQGQSPPYNISVFEDVGRAFCLGLLDFIDKNPISRIPHSTFKDLEGVKGDILSKNPIFIQKKRKEEILAKKPQNRSLSTQRDRFGNKVQVPPLKKQPLKKRTVSTGPVEINLTRQSTIAPKLPEPKKQEDDIDLASGCSSSAIGGGFEFADSQQVIRFDSEDPPASPKSEAARKQPTYKLGSGPHTNPTKEMTAIEEANHPELEQSPCKQKKLKRLEPTSALRLELNPSASLPKLSDSKLKQLEAKINETSIEMPSHQFETPLMLPMPCARTQICSEPNKGNHKSELSQLKDFMPSNAASPPDYLMNFGNVPKDLKEVQANSLIDQFLEQKYQQAKPKPFERNCPCGKAHHSSSQHSATVASHGRRSLADKPKRDSGVALSGLRQRLGESIAMDKQLNRNASCGQQLKPERILGNRSRKQPRRETQVLRTQNISLEARANKDNIENNHYLSNNAQLPSQRLPSFKKPPVTLRNQALKTNFERSAKNQTTVKSKSGLPLAGKASMVSLHQNPIESISAFDSCLQDYSKSQLRIKASDEGRPSKLQQLLTLTNSINEPFLRDLDEKIPSSSIFSGLSTTTANPKAQRPPLGHRAVERGPKPPPCEDRSLIDL